MLILHLPRLDMDAYEAVTPEVAIPRVNVDAYTEGQEDESLFGFMSPGADALPFQVGSAHVGGGIKTVAISKAPTQKKLDRLSKNLARWATAHRIRVEEGEVFATPEGREQYGLNSGRRYYINSGTEADILGQEAKNMAFPHKGIYFFLVPTQKGYIGMFASDPRVPNVHAAGTSWNGGSVLAEGFFQNLGKGLGLDKASKLARCRKLLEEGGYTVSESAKAESAKAEGLDEDPNLAEASAINLTAAAAEDDDLALEAASVVFRGFITLYTDGRITITPLDATEPQTAPAGASGFSRGSSMAFTPIGPGMLPLHSVNGLSRVGASLLPMSSVNGFWDNRSFWGDANTYGETPGYLPGAEYSVGTRESFWSNDVEDELDDLEEDDLVDPEDYHPGYLYQGSPEAAGVGCACQQGPQAGALTTRMSQLANYYGGARYTGSSRRAAPATGYGTAYPGRGGYRGGSGNFGSTYQGGASYVPPQVYAQPVPVVAPVIVAYDPLGTPLVYDAYGNLVPLPSLPIASGLAGEDVQYPGLGF